MPGRSTRSLERMPKWKPGAIVAVFLFADLTATSLLAPEVEPWLVESLLAVSFAWAYVAYGGGSSLSAIGWVVAVSVIYPLIVLTIIGIAANQSWPELFRSIRQSAQVVAFVGPVVAASLVLAARGSMRSNNALEADRGA